MIMPLDAALRPEHLTSTLHYLKRGTEKPARYRIEPPPGVPRWNGTDDPRDVTIEDARGREAEFTLDRNGFALVKAPTAVADFYSPEEIKRVYYPEVERLCAARWGPTASLSSTTTCETQRGPVCRCRRVRCTTTTR